MNEHYDALETRPRAQRENEQMAALSVQIAHAQKNTPAFARILQGVNAASVTDRTSLAKLPVTRKHELLALQQAGRPKDSFGGFAAVLRGPKLARIFASPGPIYEPDGVRPDYWRSARALYAAGFRSGDLVHNSFSYHMTGWPSVASALISAMPPPIWVWWPTKPHHARAWWSMRAC